MKFYDFVLHLLQTVWKNIETERNTGMSKLMRFLWDTRYIVPSPEIIEKRKVIAPSPEIMGKIAPSWNNGKIDQFNPNVNPNLESQDDSQYERNKRQ